MSINSSISSLTLAPTSSARAISVERTTLTLRSAVDFPRRYCGDIGIPAKSIDGYLALLANAFIITLLPAWSTNLSAKVVRAPKLHLVDPGLAGHLMGATPARPGTQPTWIGPLLETFVASEIRRQLAWSRQPSSMWHFRDRSGPEVDIVLEHPDGRIVGIEVKASSTIAPRDLRGLTYLRDRLGTRFHRGVVLSTAPEAVPAGDRISALPISALWEPTQALW